MQQIDLDILDKERVADVSDRASVEEVAFADEALVRQRRIATKTMPPPTEDGTCACGCGEDVEPQRLRLGLGLALECAKRQERARGTFRS